MYITGAAIRFPPQISSGIRIWRVCARFAVFAEKPVKSGIFKNFIIAVLFAVLMAVVCSSYCITGILKNGSCCIKLC